MVILLGLYEKYTSRLHMRTTTKIKLRRGVGAEGKSEMNFVKLAS
jgi:hypothetical protein